MSPNWVDFEKQASDEMNASTMSRRMNEPNDIKSGVQSKHDSRGGILGGFRPKYQSMSDHTDWAAFERTWKQLHNEDLFVVSSAHNQSIAGPNPPLPSAAAQDADSHEQKRSCIEEKTIQAHQDHLSHASHGKEATMPASHKHDGENKATACSHEQELSETVEESMIAHHDDNLSHAARRDKEATMHASQHHDGENKATARSIHSTVSSNYESDFIFCPTPAMETQRSLPESASCSSYRSELSQTTENAEHATRKESPHAVHHGGCREELRGIRYADDCAEKQQGLSELDLRGLEVVKCVLDKLYRASHQTRIGRMRKYFECKCARTHMCTHAQAPRCTHTEAYLHAHRHT
jgi:hypothetical protein